MNYPKVGHSWKPKKKVHKKCKCGDTATRKIDIQVNCMRGDDEVIWSCDKHKDDVKFLLEPIND